jgi:hypothetical protein
LEKGFSGAQNQNFTEKGNTRFSNYLSERLFVCIVIIYLYHIFEIHFPVEALLSINRRVGLESFSYFMLILGTLGDHVSTIIALTRPYIYESNPFTLWLMERGLWLPFDAALVALGIAVPYLILRRTDRDYFKALLIYPFLHGLIRLGASLWNFSLII